MARSTRRAWPRPSRTPLRGRERAGSLPCHTSFDGRSTCRRVVGVALVATPGCSWSIGTTCGGMPTSRVSASHLGVVTWTVVDADHGALNVDHAVTLREL